MGYILFLLSAIAWYVLPAWIVPLAALAGILKRCLLVIGNDSGPMHLAASMGTATVSIFGPVDASVYGPVNPRGRVVLKGLACRPCYQSFRFPPCPWENGCLRLLPESEVLKAVDELMEEPAHGAH